MRVQYQFPPRRERKVPYMVVVDDNELLLRAIKRWLFGELGWEADCFSDAREAADFFRDHRELFVDIFLVDQRMPKMNGIEFLLEVQEYQPEAIQILMTGHDYQDTVTVPIQALNLYYFMEKPWDPQKLSLMLQRAWERILLTNSLENRLGTFEENFKNLQAIQEELERNRQLAQIGDLVQGICHNLNTPINAILGQLEVLDIRLAEHPGDLVPIRTILPAVQGIHVATQRLQQIVGTLMAKGGLEQTDEKEKQSINALIRRELEFLQVNDFIPKEVEITLELAEDLPEVLIRYAEISQVFGNVLTNALDATQEVEAPQLKIRTTSEGEAEDASLVIEVHDNGPGVPEELRERIFDPFFTTKISSKPQPREPSRKPGSKPRGVGLGLQIARKLLKGYDGSVTVDDSPLGGALFKISFPLKTRVETEENAAHNR